MVEIIGVRFNSAGKIYYFDPMGEELEIGTKVLVETARGIELGHIVIANKQVEEDEIVAPLKPIIRKATEDDFKRVAENKEKEKDAFIIAVEKIREHKIDMKLVDVEYTFDGSKIMFYFTADGRVDFRELVKSLASVFHTRIELRQIGVRDEARQIGSIGICGRNLCCATFLDDFRPVSIKMAKEQGLSLNPTKISGVCGRLMCCLQYEQNAYDDMIDKLPNRGQRVETADGRGIVTDIATLKGEIKVKFEDGDGFRFGNYKIGDFNVLGSKPNKDSDFETSNEDEIKNVFEAENENMIEIEQSNTENSSDNSKGERKFERRDRRQGQRRPRVNKAEGAETSESEKPRLNRERGERRDNGKNFKNKRRGGYNKDRRVPREKPIINPSSDDPEAN